MGTSWPTATAASCGVDHTDGHRGAVPLRRVNESQRRLRTWIAALVTLKTPFLAFAAAMLAGMALHRTLHAPD